MLNLFQISNNDNITKNVRNALDFLPWIFDKYLLAWNALYCISRCLSKAPSQYFFFPFILLLSAHILRGRF